MGIRMRTVAMKMLVGACGSNDKGDGGLWGLAKWGCDVVVVGIWVWWWNYISNQFTIYLFIYGIKLM